VADEPVVLLFLSTLSDGCRVAAFAEDPPRQNGVLIDQHGVLEPDEPFYGRAAKDWPDGTYTVQGERLEPAELLPPDA
jgi:hypothetical protein